MLYKRGDEWNLIQFFARRKSQITLESFAIWQGSSSGGIAYVFRKFKIIYCFFAREKGFAETTEMNSPSDCDSELCCEAAGLPTHCYDPQQCCSIKLRRDARSRGMFPPPLIHEDDFLVAWRKGIPCWFCGRLECTICPGRPHKSSNNKPKKSRKVLQILFPNCECYCWWQSARGRSTDGLCEWSENMTCCGCGESHFLRLRRWWWMSDTTLLQNASENYPNNVLLKTIVMSGNNVQFSRWSRMQSKYLGDTHFSSWARLTYDMCVMKTKMLQ